MCKDNNKNTVTEEGILENKWQRVYEGIKHNGKERQKKERKRNKK